MMAPMVFLAAITAVQVPTFSSKVEIVGVTVSVTDQQTQTPIGDLKEDDFVVTENGIPQRIVHFGQQDVPASVLVLLDASTSVHLLLPYIQQAAARLIRSLRPTDEVQVAQFATQYQELSDFTIDHEAAVASLQHGFVNDDTTILYRALMTAAGTLAHRFPENVERRRVLILLSDGENTQGSFSKEVALDYVRRSGVLCYVVYLSSPPMGLLNAEHMAAVRLFMERIAYESGGRFVDVPRRQPLLLTRVYDDIAEELGAQYHLAYESASTRFGWHEIGVMLRSGAGIALRYRRGYYADRH